MKQAYIITQLDRHSQRWDKVEVLGQAGTERHYFRVRLPWGAVQVVNDSLIRWELVA